ncbi:hypothetical protein [Nonomuraea dietziae]|uniref:hypothetical protein n=1 Tax=Nonomuraea dietziae TaxID=65515 RepID=UPI0033FBABD5
MTGLDTAQQIVRDAQYGSAMKARIDLTPDCMDAQLLAEFWKTALAYIDEPPPAPFETCAEWLAQFDLPENQGPALICYVCFPLVDQMS